MPDDLRSAEREKIARRLDRSARRVALCVVPIALIATVDLTTGSLLADQRMDIVLLIAAAMTLSAGYSFRRLANRFRAGDLSAHPSSRQWASAGASMATSLAFSAGVGYLLGGWVVAAILPSATLIFVASLIAVGMQRRRRLKAEAGERPGF